mgnify:CR=1 FL=1
MQQLGYVQLHTATSYDHEAWLPKLQDAEVLCGACGASYRELATAVCSWLHARQRCLLAAHLHVATPSYKLQNARGFPSNASYKLQCRLLIRV